MLALLAGAVAAGRGRAARAGVGRRPSAGFGALTSAHTARSTRRKKR